MSIEKVGYNRDGGPIVAEIKSGYAQPGSYGFLLWEANANRIVMEKKGNFINSDDDSYPLPTPNEANHERIAECVATVAITPDIKNYRIDLIVSQDGGELGRVFKEGESDGPTVMVDIFVQLEST